MKRFLEEFFSGLIFLIFLTLVISILVSLRVSLVEFDSNDSRIDITQIQESESMISSIKRTFSIVSTFNFGKTKTGEDVLEHLKKRVEPTISLALFATILGSFLGILISLLIHYKWHRLEFFFKAFFYSILSTPIFVVGIILFIVFGILIPVFPPGGFESGKIAFLVLPGITLGSRVLARIYFFTGELMVSEKNSQLSFNLEAMGFSKFRIIFKYSFYKIFPVILIVIMLEFASLVSGAMIVEEIFAFPGIGKSIYYAIKVMDENLLRAVLFYTGVLFYIVNKTAKVLQVKLVG
ncbi:MAG: ABC transporter permease [Leptospiraceae bacterium]|nr:ABC transporter permease [Leptospiraceae bacterium]